MKSKSASVAELLKRLVRPAWSRRWNQTHLRIEQLQPRITPATFNAGNDALFADGAVGTATPAGGSASLRRVLELANGNSDATNTINLTGAYSLTIAQAAQENDNVSGDLDIRNTGTPGTPKTYIFAGLGTTKIQQTLLDRVFQIVGTDVVVRFQNVTISGGHAVDDGTAGATAGSTDAKGGGILNSDGADVFFTNAVLTGNEAGNGAATAKTVMDGVAGLAGTATTYDGKNGGDAKSAFGGAVYSKGGAITVSGTSDFTGNRVGAGVGGVGGKGFTSTVAAKAGGIGGNGGKGGTALGGGIYADGGSVSIAGSASIRANAAVAGAGGAAGNGGKAANLAGAQFGGAGGRGGDGGNAGGGGIYLLSGPVSLSGSAQILNNAVNGVGAAGQGGRGGNGGDMQHPAGAGGGGAGGNGGTGGNAVGGGLAVLSGAVTIGTGTQVTGNSVNSGGGLGATTGAGAGGTAGIGGNAVAGAGRSGGNGGAGGSGGTAFGGGVFAANGKVAISGLVQTNRINAGIAAAAGGLGAHGGAGKNGAGNGAGGGGGDAGGAGVYVSVGSVVLTSGQVIGNQGTAGAGGTGGNGSSAGATTANGFGRAGGNGGNGGSFFGGGIYAGAGDVLLDLASKVNANTAAGVEGGDGGVGGAGGTGQGVGGVGGKGGVAGGVFGGGVYAKAGNVTIQGASVVSGNKAGVFLGKFFGSGDGGNGGAGGKSKSAAGGAGGLPGTGGKAGGGGVYIVAGNLSLLGGSSVDNNLVLSGRGQQGGAGGASKFKGGAGASASSGAPAVGGGVAVELGDVTIGGSSKITQNAAEGGLGNNGGKGGNALATAGVLNVAGNAGNAADGGLAEGGGIWAQKGNVTIQGQAQITQNQARGGQGGTGGAGGVGAAGFAANGAGGNGGNAGASAGGGLWVQDGSVNVSGSAAFTGNRADHTAGQVGGVAGQRGNAATTGNINGNAVNGSGGNGGLAQGGAIWSGAATVTISGRSTFTNNQAVGGGGGLVPSLGPTGIAGGKAGKGGAGGSAEGGAIFAQSGAVTVTLSKFSGNLATGGVGEAGGKFGTVVGGAGAGGAGGDARGGAIATNTGTLTLTEVNFGGVGATVAGSDKVQINTAGTGNIATGGAAGDGGMGKTAPGGNGGSSIGGAVSASATGVVTMLNSSFFNNLAADGGAAGAGAPAGLQGKSLGGAFASEGAATNLTNSTFSQNAVGDSTTESSGGAIYLNGVTAKIHNSTVVLNTGVASTQAGGIRANGGGVDLVSTIVGQNGLTASVGAALTGPGKDISATASLTGNNNLIENLTGFTGISDGTNGNVIGKSFTNPSFNDPTLGNKANALSMTGGPGNTVFVIGSQTAPNGTARHGLVTASVFPTLPTGALSALNGGANPNGLLVDQIQNPRVQGLAADVGAIEGNGSVTDTQGAFVVSVVFSTKLAPGTATFDTATVTFSEAIDPTSFGVAQVLSLTAPDGSPITPTAVAAVAGSGNTVFEVSFPNSDALGVYTLLLSQTIRDTAVGTQNQMDDNRNGINGEASPNPIGTNGPGDQDLATGVLRDPTITSGANVTSAVFSGTAGAFNKVTLTFDQAIDAATITAADVTVTGDAGAPTIFVTGVTLKAGTANVFDVTFTPAVAGNVTVTLGVNILNFGGVAGLPMNQNGNAINGEPGVAPAGDQFQAQSNPPTPGVLAVGGTNGRVRILNAATGAVIASVRPLDAAASGYFGLISVALGDFDADGVPDLVVAPANPLGVAGLDATKAGKAFVYDGVDLVKGTLTLDHTFTPFTSTDGPAGQSGVYINGLNIAVGDVDGDGQDDLIAGTRGGSATAGLAEYGRFVVVDKGTKADGSDDSTIGGITTPFGPAYQKGVVVAAGDLDGVLNAGGRIQDEIAATRGGPVAATNPNKTVKLKAFQFDGSIFVDLNLSGTGSPLAPFAGIGTDDTVIQRDARVAFVDTNADGKQELVFSALDRTTDPTNIQVRIAAFSVDTTTGLATAISTGTGPSKSYVVGANIVDHAIAGANPTGTGLNELALITESATSGIQYLDPLTGNVSAAGFPLTITTGGVTLDGL